MDTNPKAVFCTACRQLSPAGSLTCMACGQPIGAPTAPATTRSRAGAVAFGFAWNPAKTAVAILAFALLYALAFILPLDPAHHPLTRLAVLFACLSLATASMVFVDCDLLGIADDRRPDARQLTPLQWFVVVAVAWPIGFPLYAWRRTKLRPDATSYAALAGAAVFLVTAAVMWMLLAARPEHAAPGGSTSASATAPLQINGTVVDRSQGPVIIQNGQALPLGTANN